MKKWILMIVCICAILLVSLLLMNGCFGTESLLKAIEAENVEEVKMLLDEGVDPNQTNIAISKFWEFLETSPKRPLSRACITGNKTIVELLVAYGATAEYIEGSDWSPLMATVWYYQPDDIEIVQLLLEHGADPNLDEGSYMPLFVAAKMKPQVYDSAKSNGTVFLDGYDEETAQGITEIVILLLGDQSVDVTTDTGLTLLMCSAQSGNLFLADYLIEHSCDVNAKDINGKTALDYAINNDQTDMIRLLSALQA